MPGISNATTPGPSTTTTPTFTAGEVKMKLKICMDFFWLFFITHFCPTEGCPGEEWKRHKNKCYRLMELGVTIVLRRVLISFGSRSLLTPVSDPIVPCSLPTGRKFCQLFTPLLCPQVATRDMDQKCKKLGGLGLHLFKINSYEEKYADSILKCTAALWTIHCG